MVTMTAPIPTSDHCGMCRGMLMAEWVIDQMSWQKCLVKKCVQCARINWWGPIHNLNWPHAR